MAKLGPCASSWNCPLNGARLGSHALQLGSPEQKAVKVYLDDLRPCPDGWILAKTAHEAIKLLMSGKVTAISLDHDLGPPEAGTGYDVCLWIEEKVYQDEGQFKPPIMEIHSANPVGRQKMNVAIQSIHRRSV